MRQPQAHRCVEFKGHQIITELDTCALLCIHLTLNKTCCKPWFTRVAECPTGSSRQEDAGPTWACSSVLCACRRDRTSQPSSSWPWRAVASRSIRSFSCTKKARLSTHTHLMYQGIQKGKEQERHVIPLCSACLSPLLQIHRLKP